MTSDDVTVELLGRAGLRFRKGARRMIVDSEILAGPEHSMCVFRSSIERWDPPHQDEPITEAQRARIIEDIRGVLRSKGYADIEVM
jgi:hypothetical protein